MTKFRIGDKVKIVKNTGAYRFNEYVGKTRKVIRLDSDGRVVIKTGDNCAWGPDELIKPKSIALPPKSMQKRLFTCSTQVFSSIAEAENQLDEWNDVGTLNPDTKVYEIKMDAFDSPVEYYPVIKLVKVEI